MTSCLLFVFVALLACSGATAESDCRVHPWPYPNNTLLPGQWLHPGEFLAVSTAYLIVEPSGSLALYRGTFPSTANKWWSSDTDGTGPNALTLTTGGDLVLRNVATGDTVWHANTTNSSIAVLQDNCALALYNIPPLTNQTWVSPSPLCLVAHIVPHSHDDVGWLLTPERYYDGCHDPTGGVQSIIGSMVQALAANRSRTFVQVESYFFNRWWKLQNDTVKATVQRLVDNKQFVFINGGWSMHDEACVHQESAIANMAIGAQFISDTFNANLSIGWHIDPFGHASTTPRLMAQMGFNGFFFWRTDYEQRNFMMQTQTLETLWRPSPSIGDAAAMFTSILYEDYCQGCRVAGQGGFPTCPTPFCCYSCEVYDTLPSWQQYFNQIHLQSRRQTHLSDIARSFGVSELHPSRIRTQDLASLYAQNIQQYASNFRTNQVLMPWGCDFEHINAPVSFALMDDILAELNGNASYGITGFYSTPQTYLDAVHALNYSWPTNEFDYFLDSDNGHAYWSGYFSSRAAYKRFERFLMNHRSAVEIALSSTQRADLTIQNARVRVFQEAMGVAQHHDSITGTERLHVRDRYQYMLSEGLFNASLAMEDIFETLTGVSTEPCFLSNLSSCAAVNALLDGSPMSVYVYNPLAWNRTEVLVIPVPTAALSVFVNQSGTRVALVAQIQPTWVLTTSDDPTSPPAVAQPFELLVRVELPPMSIVEVILVPTNNSTAAGTTAAAVPVVTAKHGASKINSSSYSVAFNATTGGISAIENSAAASGFSPVKQNIYSYCPMGPNQGQASGAYIFRPCQPNAPPTPFNETFGDLLTLSGPVCEEVRQVISPHHSIQQTVRVCSGLDYVDLITGIGPVDPGFQGLEVVMKVRTEVHSNSTWYTDSEGLELQQRLRNRHLNYPHVVTEPIASNFYPCNSFALINETSGSASFVTVADYSRGTTSLVDGELEFLMIRRLLYDDNRGVAQPLNENIRILTSTRILFNERDAITAARKQSVLHAHPPILRFGAPSTKAWRSAFGIQSALPPNVLLHTRQQLADGVLLLRLQHTHAVGEGVLASPVTVSINQVVPPQFAVRRVVETDVNAVMPLAQANAQRLVFRACDATKGTTKQIPTSFAPSLQPDGVTVLLHPMDLRTFVVTGAWLPEDN